MSEKPKSAGAAALGWWHSNLHAEDSGSARALAARLRRGGPVAVLSEPAVQELAKQLALGPERAADLVRLVRLLAEIRENQGTRLAERLGGSDPVLSRLRFQKLMRAEGDELATLLRRAIVMAGRRCNVAALASDLLDWEAARTRWCFQYFSADAPEDNQKESV
ncbi:type I-E CRISPR-associated protein Cse2/CasB [Roseibium sp. RKSG952]|uniref:type I-E CRISPR-associated protein Cse2/CasB n=1 Tax=Roseibium sp. RKSG952 TaxID=2529384 RepID=UPI0012BC1B74|nr:type I-E CRISPR-associated protein Cse2/CasB [Roseibium sp. RKSG952]MTH95150.1 type I-E CRISPR-associated protein Cse2/CasB [Roseibium sp. RKSG952]